MEMIFSEKVINDPKKMEIREYSSNFELFIQAVTQGNMSYIKYFKESGNSLRGFHDLALKAAFKKKNKEVLEYLLNEIMIDDNELEKSIYFDVLVNGLGDLAVKVFKTYPKMKMDMDWVIELATVKGQNIILEYFIGKYDYSEHEDLLLKAIKHNQIESVKFLINYIDVECRNNLALKLASTHGNLDIVKLLIEKGANIKDSQAIIVGTEEVKKYLAEKVKETI